MQKSSLMPNLIFYDGSFLLTLRPSAVMTSLPFDRAAVAARAPAHANLFFILPKFTVGKKLMKALQTDNE